MNENRKSINEIAEQLEEPLLLADGFDDAIIGVAYRIGQPALVTYDKQIMLEILLQDGMTEEDALEYLEYNVYGAYVGEQTPLFLERI